MWRDHQTSTTTMLALTTRRDIVSNDDAMEHGIRRLRQIEGKALGAVPINKQSIRIRTNPAFCPPYLFCRPPYRTAKPTTPIEAKVASVRKRAIFVREY